MDPRSILSSVTSSYMEFQNKYADRRAGDYPIMNDPSSMLAITFCYILTVVVGPRLMEHRKPFSLLTFNKYYNIAQLMFCFYYVTSVYNLVETNVDGVWLMCKRYDSSDSPEGRRKVLFSYINFIARMVELSETVVHVLRKKTRNLSYLHVIHHVINFDCSWMFTRYAPGGTELTVCMVNYAVHFIMFSYYLATVEGNEPVKKFANKYKKFLTLTQMTQFIFLALIIGQDMTNFKGCGFSGGYRFLSVAAMFGALINLGLFINFYAKNYTSNSVKIPAKNKKK